MSKIIRNLVMSAVGDNSLHRYWSKHNEWKYHKFMMYFGDGAGYEEEATYHQKAKGYKYHLMEKAVQYLLKNNLLDQYDYVWMPDDDIYLEEQDVLRLFNYMKNYDLAIAQPSILGWYGVDMTLHQKGSLLRYTNWVEIMCPCFSVPALKLCLDTFCENDCGWGIETLWNIRLGHPTDKIAIIDDVAAFHTRPVFKGETYKDKDSPVGFSRTKPLLEDALDQAKKVYDKYNVSEEVEKDLINGEPTNGEVYGSVVYKQIKKEMEFDIEKPDRFWPPCDSMENYLSEIRENKLNSKA
jgi:hypothetical protein